MRELSMGYDLEKYRIKREKVLGVKRRGITFARLAALFTIGIFLMVGLAVLPQAIAYMKNRNLDDVIYKIEGNGTWWESNGKGVTLQQGVEGVQFEKEKNRVIITFNRELTTPEKLEKFIKKHGQEVVMLNVIGHSQRLKIVAEEAKFETF
jgi:hypothetical protein